MSARRAPGGGARDAAQVLAGQAAFSLANFLTILALGRWAGPAELGAYALGLSCYFLAVSLGDTLLATPYTYFRAQPPAGRGTRDLPAVAAWGTLGLVAVLAMLLCGAWWLDVTVLGRLWPVLPAALALALLREFQRRHLAASGRHRALMRTDLTSAAVQLAGIGALAMGGGLDAASAFAVFGLAAAAVLAPLLTARTMQRLRMAWRETPAALARFFGYGRWLLAGGLCHVASVQFYPWLALASGGERLAGLFAACLALVNLIGPVLTGLTTYFRPRFMTEAQRRGRSSFLAFVGTRAVAFVLPALAAAALLALAGTPLLVWLYGAGYAEGGPALAWMGLGMLAVAVGAPLQLGLLALRAPVTNLYYHGAALLMLVAAASWMASPDIHVLGRLHGLVNLAATALLGAMFWACARALPAR